MESYGESAQKQSDGQLQWILGYLGKSDASIDAEATTVE